MKRAIEGASGPRTMVECRHRCGNEQNHTALLRKLADGRAFPFRGQIHHTAIRDGYAERGEGVQ